MEMLSVLKRLLDSEHGHFDFPKVNSSALERTVFNIQELISILDSRTELVLSAQPLYARLDILQSEISKVRRDFETRLLQGIWAPPEGLYHRIEVQRPALEASMIRGEEVPVAGVEGSASSEPGETPESDVSTLVNDALKAFPKEIGEKVTASLRTAGEATGLSFNVEKESGEPVEVSKITNRSGETLWQGGAGSSLEKSGFIPLTAPARDLLTVHFNSSEPVNIYRLQPVDFSPTEVFEIKETIVLSKETTHIQIPKLKFEGASESWMSVAWSFVCGGEALEVEAPGGFSVLFEEGEDEPESQVFFLNRESDELEIKVVFRWVGTPAQAAQSLSMALEEVPWTYQAVSGGQLALGLELDENVLLDTVRLVSREAVPTNVRERVSLGVYDHSKGVSAATWMFEPLRSDLRFSANWDVVSPTWDKHTIFFSSAENGKTIYAWFDTSRWLHASEGEVRLRHKEFANAALYSMQPDSSKERSRIVRSAQPTSFLEIPIEGDEFPFRVEAVNSKGAVLVTYTEVSGAGLYDLEIDTWSRQVGQIVLRRSQAHEMIRIHYWPTKTSVVSFRDGKAPLSEVGYTSETVQLQGIGPHVIPDDVFDISIKGWERLSSSAFELIEDLKLPRDEHDGARSWFVLPYLPVLQDDLLLEGGRSFVWDGDRFGVEADLVEITIESAIRLLQQNKRGYIFEPGSLVFTSVPSESVEVTYKRPLGDLDLFLEKPIEGLYREQKRWKVDRTLPQGRHHLKYKTLPNSEETPSIRIYPKYIELFERTR